MFMVLNMVENVLVRKCSGCFMSSVSPLIIFTNWKKWLWIKFNLLTFSYSPHFDFALLVKLTLLLSFTFHFHFNSSFNYLSQVHIFQILAFQYNIGKIIVFKKFYFDETDLFDKINFVLKANFVLKSNEIILQN